MNLTDAEFAQLLEAAVLAERAACLAVCMQVYEFSDSPDASLAWNCVEGIQLRNVNKGARDETAI